SERAEIIESGAEQRIKINCPPGLIIHVPKSAFLLMISNLIENAIKYSPDGGDVKVLVGYDGQHHIKISITDPGFGLEKTELKKIFRMFHRGTLANTKAIKGTGIGLFIVKTVSKVLGGFVWAESEGRGTGSTFHLRLPMNRLKKFKA
ncbi:ATP-binding protein, partial [bacterium]|nr:ATP-binding protein [bacterium]